VFKTESITKLPLKDVNDLPTKKVIYSPMEGVKLIDYYCEADFDKFMKKKENK
jgi:hypothetical protein